MKHVLAVVMICFLVTPFLYAQDHSTDAAQKSAESWLTLVDSSRYGESWDHAASVFRSAITREQWQKTIANSRGQFGQLMSRKLKNATYTTTLPGAPDGQYVVIQYETSFENKKSGVETITPMVDKDGEWRVSGYFIR